MLTQETIAHTAHLAGLHLDATQSANMQQQLDQILAWVAVLQNIDTTNVEPLIHPTEVLNTWAEDIAKEGFTHTEALHNAPQHNESHFLVPKVAGL
ncbi:MAG: Asp-tRNA(Asn)/Glu-tRNA(Gln) amidotransferase subunit GatC [Bacteroidetes bacterium]|nr:MAG: Asp-tRNA(Asn)/Glu-tRNA(Gln) amidotransferase subunit GatC [Bacteroidota bacterium]